MIKAYLTGIASEYEGEDIEVRYSIFEDQNLLSRESIIMEYEKPSIVGQVALITLLTKLEKYIGKEIVVIVNDPALAEIIRGTSTTKNTEILKMADKTRKALTRFENIVITDVSKDRLELANWNETL